MYIHKQKYPHTHSNLKVLEMENCLFSFFDTPFTSSNSNDDSQLENKIKTRRGNERE